MKRRDFVAMVGALPALTVAPCFVAAGEAASALVYRTPTCGCCGKWIEHLRRAGFAVEVREVPSTTAIREELGVPRQLTSCHTAIVGDYWVEGHVPADLVLRLLDERPADIAGIAVPGMPAGSPGMESPQPVEYDIIAYGRDGGMTRYARRTGRSTTD